MAHVLGISQVFSACPPTTMKSIFAALGLLIIAGLIHDSDDAGNGAVLSVVDATMADMEVAAWDTVQDSVPVSVQVSVPDMEMVDTAGAVKVDGVDPELATGDTVLDSEMAADTVGAAKVDGVEPAAGVTADTVPDSETADTVPDSETADTVPDSETADTGGVVKVDGVEPASGETADTVPDTVQDMVPDTEMADTAGVVKVDGVEPASGETADTVLDTAQDTVPDTETADTAGAVKVDGVEVVMETVVGATEAAVWVEATTARSNSTPRGLQTFRRTPYRLSVSYDM
ncbi:hypothetical protein MAR_005275 [Mya arenaria]|uniref:Uncharacterized protein n=1 Tax=Mya arenaria TaxID=6604 RepID=A0ABY7EZ22_MYAAR|nr:hypothetical protein MAR_005275 [Mya arenaria]